MTARRRNWLLIFVVMVFIVVLRTFTGPVRADTDYFDTRKPQIIAHQGGNLLRPGNTMLAFNHARSLGVDVLEMDAHTAATGEVVLMHDDTVDRTTDGSGALIGMGLDQIKALDAAYHWPFDGDSTPYRGKGVRVPTLAEVLERFPGMPLNIEIKQETPSMAQPLCTLLRAHCAERRVLVASFHRGAMLEFRETCPEVATSAFSGEVTLFLVHQKLGLASLYKPEAHALQLPAERFGIDLHAESIMRAAAQRRMHFDAWTINDEVSLERLFVQGVGGVITDRPDLAVAVRQRLGG